jgi:hypothetical protein
MEMSDLPQVTTNLKMRERIPIELGGLVGPRALPVSSKLSLQTLNFFTAEIGELLH